MNIKLRVSNLIKHFDTANPYHIASELGIKVYRLELPASVRGFYAVILRRKFIVINQDLNATASKVVVSHELGHALLHRGYGYYFSCNQQYYRSSRREAQANEFAAWLLVRTSNMDQELAMAYLKEHRHDPTKVHSILRKMIDN